MKVINLLNEYVNGGEVAEMTPELLEVIATEPQKLIHSVLVDFNNLNCSFNFDICIPLDYGEARELLSTAESLSEKYVYALYCLKLQHYICAKLVQGVLRQIGVSS